MEELTILNPLLSEDTSLTVISVTGKKKRSFS